MHPVLQEIEDNERKLFAINDHQGFGSVTDLVLPTARDAGVSLPVLFTAPHSIKQVRDDAEKEQDDYTGAIAMALARLTGGMSLAMAGRQTADPMQPTITDINGDDHPFKQAIIRAYREQGIGIVFDLHGLGAPKSTDIGCDIGVGLGSMPNVASGFMARALKKTAESMRLRVKVGNAAFAALKRSTVTGFCLAKGFYAVQLELAPWVRFGDDYKKRLDLLRLLVMVARTTNSFLPAIDLLNHDAVTRPPYFALEALQDQDDEESQVAQEARDEQFFSSLRAAVPTAEPTPEVTDRHSGQLQETISREVREGTGSGFLSERTAEVPTHPVLPTDVGPSRELREVDRRIREGTDGSPGQTLR